MRPMPAARALHVFDCGTFRVPAFLLFGPPASGSLTMPILAFAIELEDRSFVLVDAGIEPARWSRLRALALRGVSVLARGRSEPGRGHAGRLAALGIEASRVRAVVMTHLDYDHTGGLPGLAARPVYVAREEWAYARAPALRDRLLRNHVGDYAALSALREVAFDGAREGGLAAFEVPEAEGAAAMVSLPGHTPGHAGVLVRLAGGRRVLLCGDAAYAVEHVAAARPLGPLVRLFAHDWRAARRTVEDLRRFARAEPGLRVIPSHDPATGALCAAAPRCVEA
jgi:glyoxylase-like metal-dependent hydrolase (beta-lactamase superfamily II)